jgi:hypothetical protein
VTTDHTTSRTDDRDAFEAPATIDQPKAPEPSRWRFSSAVHAARALNGQPA